MEFKYSLDLFWSDEDGCYIARIPEFPGLSAFGDSPEAAVAEAKSAALDFIEVLQEDGDEIPAPRKLKRYSGQLRIRIPSSLHESLTIEAARERMSLNSYILYVLSKEVGKAEASQPDLKYYLHQEQFPKYIGEYQVSSGPSESLQSLEFTGSSVAIEETIH